MKLGTAGSRRSLSDDWQFSERLATALAAAALCLAIQMVFFRGVSDPLAVPLGEWPGFGSSRSPVSGPLFASQALVLVLVHVLAAFVLGGIREARAWAALVFLLPVLPSLPFLGQADGALPLALTLAGVAIGCWLWARAGRGPGAPLVASVAGAVLGAELLRFRAEAYRGFHTEPAALVLPALVAIAAGAAMLLGGWFPAALVRPSRSFSLNAVVLGSVVAAILAAAGRAGLGSLPRLADPGVELPPVVLVVLDTVRADHLRIHGYARDTMPNLERLVRENGAVAVSAIASSSWSPSTHGSLFTGLDPPRHGAHGPFVDDPDPPVGYALREGVPTLAELLGGAGYSTVAISGNYGLFESLWGLSRGFDMYRGDANAAFALKQRTPWRFATRHVWPLAFLDRLPPFSDCEFFGRGVEYRRAPEITDDAIAVIDAQGERPFFLFVNYFDAHAPYLPPGRFADSFPGRSSSLPTLLLPKVMHPLLSGERNLTAAEQAHLSSLYDGELAFLDAELARLLDRLKQHPRWSEMLVVITSDHGESLGEHGLLEHGSSLYEEQVRVPLFVKPGTQAPWRHEVEVRTGLVGSADVFAMVLQHAGLPLPAGIDGMTGGRTEARSWLYKLLKRAQNYPERFDRELRSIVVADGWKLIESTSGEVELYDLRRDPGESHNAAQERPELLATLRAALGPRVADRPSLPTEGLSEGGLERLRALGYAD